MLHIGRRAVTRINRDSHTKTRNATYPLPLAIALIIAFSLPAAVSAAASAALAQSFSTSGGDTANIVAGSLVSSKAGGNGTIELASLNNAKQIVGIVATAPLVSLSNGDNTISVVISGKADALVSDINGTVKAGDKITASPIAGVGMKATDDSQIVGTAQADQVSSGKTATRTVKDTKGTEHAVKINQVPIQTGVAYYQAPGSSFLPPIIQRTADSIAGRPVSLIRVLLSACALIASFVTAIVLLASGVRNGMTALGRNPLSSALIYKGMYRVGAMALMALGFGLAASYLLLRV